MKLIYRTHPPPHLIPFPFHFAIDTTKLPLRLFVQPLLHVNVSIADLKHGKHTQPCIGAISRMFHACINCEIHNRPYSINGCYFRKKKRCPSHSATNTFLSPTHENKCPPTSQQFPELLMTRYVGIHQFEVKTVFLLIKQALFYSFHIQNMIMWG